MTTYDDRLATLERKVAALELRRLYDERKAEENTPSAQSVNLAEINQNMTMLLGIASGQETSIKAVEQNLSVINERLGHVDERLEGVEQRLTAQDNKLDQILALLTPKSE